MLEIIMDGRVYDFGYIFDNWQGMAFCIEIILRDPTASFESYYAKNETKATKHYTDMVKVFLE